MNGDSPGDLSPADAPLTVDDATHEAETEVVEETADVVEIDPIVDSAPPTDTTAKIDLGLHPPAIAPPPLLPIPKPKPIIIPERTDDGWRTGSLHLKHSAGHESYYLTVKNSSGKVQVIHLLPAQLESLLNLTDGAPGLLWKKLSAIPLESPLPSRALEEELRVLLTTFSPELRHARR